MRKLLTTTALTLLFMNGLAFAQTAPPQPPAIVTQGVATLKRAPDRAWVSIAVESRQGKAADARREAAAQMIRVQTAVKAAGIPEDAIKTTSYSLQPQMEWDGTRSRIRDYLAHNAIDVRIDNIDKVSDVIDAAASVPSSLILTVAVTGVRFDLKNPDALAREALTLAAKDAFGRAQAIASGINSTLGAILHVEEQRETVQPPGIRFMTAARAETSAAAPSTPIEPNEIEIRATVTLTVGIKG